MMILFKKGPLFFLVITVIVMSCKKNNPAVSPQNIESSALDSIFLYGQQIYYWNSAYPKKDVYAAKFGSLYNADKSVKVQDALNYLSLLAINPVTNRPYELNLYVVEP